MGDSFFNLPDLDEVLYRFAKLREKGLEEKQAFKEAAFSLPDYLKKQLQLFFQEANWDTSEIYKAMENGNLSYTALELRAEKEPVAEKESTAEEEGS